MLNKVIRRSWLPVVLVSILLNIVALLAGLWARTQLKAPLSVQLIAWALVVLVFFVTLGIIGLKEYRVNAKGFFIYLVIYTALGIFGISSGIFIAWHTIIPWFER